MGHVARRTISLTLTAINLFLASAAEKCHIYIFYFKITFEHTTMKKNIFRFTS